MSLLLILFFSIIIIILFKNKKPKKFKNENILNFKKKLSSKESNIERIFLREQEKTSSNPNINIIIGSYEKADNIKRKSNIHRARLSKFSKSMLNGEMIYKDKEEKIFKYIDGKKLYL
tara:strand:- start:2407 stop:2760 length:354 start_codon:yes stop_codon:yes gene_type:complete